MGADDLKASANAEALMRADVLLWAAEGRGKGAFFDVSPFCHCAGAAAVLLAIEESPGAGPAHRASGYSAVSSLVQVCVRRIEAFQLAVHFGDK